MIKVYIDPTFSIKYAEISHFLKTSDKIDIVDDYPKCDFMFPYEKHPTVTNGYTNIHGKPLSKHNIWKILCDKYNFKTFIESVDHHLIGLWIEKPIGGSCGREISVLKNPINWNKKGFILQKYLENLLLYKIDNKYHKFDTRIYVCLKNNGFYMYPNGLLRIAQKEFNIDNLEKGIHVTNTSILTHDIEKFVKIISKQDIIDHNIIINKCYDVCCYFFGKILNMYNPTKINKNNRIVINEIDIIFEE